MMMKAIPYLLGILIQQLVFRFNLVLKIPRKIPVRWFWDRSFKGEFSRGFPKSGFFGFQKSHPFERCEFFWVIENTLQGTNISHPGERKIIFKHALGAGYVSSQAVPHWKKINIFKPPSLWLEPLVFGGFIFLFSNLFWLTKLRHSLQMFIHSHNQFTVFPFGTKKTVAFAFKYLSIFILTIW